MEEEPYRRNVTALNAALIKLGMAAQSRGVTKRDSASIAETMAQFGISKATVARYCAQAAQ